MESILSFHYGMINFFDKLCGKIENHVNIFKLGWTISILSEGLFMLLTIYWIYSELMTGHFLSILIDAFCFFMSASALNELVANKGLMKSSAYKQAMRKSPEYGLSKILVVFFIAVMTLFSGNTINSTILFVVTIGYVVGFYIMISNPEPPYKRAYSFSS